jgi:hypothetical protein
MDERETPHLEEIRYMLKLLKDLDKKLLVFGSETHQYKSYPQSNDEIESFESKLGIRLPEDYRQFLQEIGYGAGPYYGLYSLERSLSVLLSDQGEQETWPPKPSQPFPISRKYAEEQFRLMSEKKAVVFNIFWPADGCIPICHEGCSGWHYLVTAGDLVGTVWSRSTPVWNPYHPIDEDWTIAPQPSSGLLYSYIYAPLWHTPRSPIPTFLDWYRTWLDQCLSDFEELKRNKS